MRRREFITLLGGGATTALRSKSVAMSTWPALTAQGAAPAPIEKDK